MKEKTCIYFYCLLFLAVLLNIESCKKEEVSPQPETVTDIDGNVYHTVKIGTQVWMVENLKVTKFNDGVAIPLVTEDLPWYFLRTPGYCWYNNDIANKTTYGALYNWYAVGTGKLAPKGWHVPTSDEWTTLTTYLGGAIQASSKLREVGVVHWATPNLNATNETGFTALPGGQRRGDNTFSGQFDSFSYSAYWWSSTTECCDEAWYQSVSPDNSFGLFGSFWAAYSGYSVRCLKD